MKFAASVVGFEAEKGGNKEIHFVWAVSYGKALEPGESKASLIPWKPLQPSAPDMGSGVHIGQSRVFEGIKPGNPLRVSGNGIPVCQPENPGKSVAVYVAAWEDDQEWRDWAEKIDAALKTQGGQQLVSYALQGALAPIAPVVDIILGALKKKPDDFFVDGLHTGFEETIYGLMPKDEEEQKRFDALEPMDVWRVWRKYSREGKGTITMLYELIPEASDAA